MNDKAFVDLFNFAFWPVLSAVIVLALTGNLGLSIALLMALGVANWQIS